MAHYVCPVGGGVADTPGTCQKEDCPHHGNPLKECGCEDGKHEKVMEKKEESK